MSDDITPGPIELVDGNVLYQLDNESGLNLWSSVIQPNNGYDRSYAIKAATLLAAAPELLRACEQAVEWLEGWASAEPYIGVLRAAISKATGEQA